MDVNTNDVLEVKRRGGGESSHKVAIQHPSLHASRLELPQVPLLFFSPTLSQGSVCARGGGEGGQTVQSIIILTFLI